MINDKYFNIRKVCPLCLSKDCADISENIISKEFIDKKWSNNFPLELTNNLKIIYTECNTCGMLYQKNILNSEYMSMLYDNWIDMKESFLKKMAASKEKKYQKLFSEKAIITQKLLGSRPKVSNCLDFGGGWGNYCDYINKDKNINECWELTEFSDIKRIWAKKYFNIKSYKTLKEINKKFDLISSDQVLEHITNPGEVLLSMHNLLKPGGFILGFFPVITNKKAKDALKHFNLFIPEQLLPLEHINVFTKKTIDNFNSILKSYLGVAIKKSTRIADNNGNIKGVCLFK